MEKTIEKPFETACTTFEEACESLGLDPAALPDVSCIPEEDRGAIIAHYKLTVIAKSLNQGWKPDWTNWDEYKYYPWFEIKKDTEHPSGVGFSYDGYDFWRTGTAVGSRLAFQSEELARYAGQQFEDLYREYFLI